jgi:hypothetical protein
VSVGFYDALGGRDDEHLVARATQCGRARVRQHPHVGVLARSGQRRSHLDSAGALRLQRARRALTRRGYIACVYLGLSVVLITIGVVVVGAFVGR